MSRKKTTSIEDLLGKREVQETTSDLSDELLQRREYAPRICSVFSMPYTVLEETDDFDFFVDKEAKRKLSRIIDNKVQYVVVDDSLKEQYGKKRNIGIVFSGGPAPGGHNVIAGLFDAAKKANPDSKIYGFLQGPDGIVENEAIELTESLVGTYRNLGGFGMIRTGRTKIDSTEKIALSKETCKTLGLDALVIVGGDDSNTNAAFLAQEMMEDGVQVLGVPKTIDGDIQVRDVQGNVLCAMSFGFHTAARAFAKEISNLYTDSTSDVKYWHICKVM
ncbi:MAG: 6-phosphofructokinase, partial [Deltaproteobacteria bacterium]|nr:6-phosphofructokinase [Deltaproteobacteria bacterium]